jgi:hypothetical protein
MAKSIRSKTKRAFRAKKREDGVYAVAHASRLQRLHAKIDAIVGAPKPPVDEILEDVENAGGDEEVQEMKTAGGCRCRKLKQQSSLAQSTNI